MGEFCIENIEYRFVIVPVEENIINVILRTKNYFWFKSVEASLSSTCLLVTNLKSRQKIILDSKIFVFTRMQLPSNTNWSVNHKIWGGGIELIL